MWYNKNILHANNQESLEDSDMKKLLILYFSGVGNTKYVAEHMYIEIKKRCVVDIKSIEKIDMHFDFSQYDKIVIGTSTYHSEPAKPMRDFLEAIDSLKNPIPAFIFATYGLYPENVLKILAELCIAKNIMVIKYSGYRCSATDGILLVPQIKYIANKEKNINEKIKKDINEFEIEKSMNCNIPRYKWYSLLNYPNKWIGQHFHFRIFLHKEFCTKCNKCVIQCPVGAVKTDYLRYPVVDRQKCINCYRCIHNCSELALSLFEKRDLKKL